MKGNSKAPRRAATAKRAGGRAPAPLPVEPIAQAIPSEDLTTFELTQLLDDVKATVLALLATLQQKERDLRQHAVGAPSPGIDAGLSDIRVMRRWADRTLHTIGVLERGKAGELHVLLDELAEFREILHDHDGIRSAGAPEVRRES